MSDKLGIGVIGCGNISAAYMRLAPLFNGIEMRACANINMDAAKVMHFPGFHPDTAAPLIARGIAGVGIDTLSLDNGRSKTFGFHVAMLKSNRYQIENMANLDALPATGATVVIGVLPVKAGSQAQARIIALLP